uniref:SERTA domain containing 2a n=1 Tax=Dicentrarchus labrax TaxID=13489 RepID=A0A8C4E4U4_DICLA
SFCFSLTAFWGSLGDCFLKQITQEYLILSIQLKSSRRRSLNCFCLHRFMSGNGVKRKLGEDDDGLEEDRRPLARQTVLNMSLMKLYGPRMGADLGLQRRVLINNIIRRIHDDFRQEGELCPSSSSSSSSPPPPPPARVLFDVVVKEEGRGFQEVASRLEKPPPPPPPPSSSSSGSFLTDFTLDDVLFTDIDTSMYDLGPCPAPSGAPPSKTAPVVMADDLVRSMSGYGPAGGGAQNQPFKMDLAELDHIMEVLVGS